MSRFYEKMYRSTANGSFIGPFLSEGCGPEIIEND